MTITPDELNLLNKKVEESKKNSTLFEQSMLQAKKINDTLFELLLSLLKERVDFKRLAEEAQKHGYSDVAQAINRVINHKGQGLLEHAFLNQDFGVAKNLIDSGAVITPRDRSAFDLALDSKVAKNAGMHPKEEKIHDVKYYGVSLGIKTVSTDGTYSQFAHLRPTYQMMTDSVAAYAKNHMQDDKFHDVSEAFTFTNKVASFSLSTSTNDPGAGKELATRIQQGKLTTIPMSCAGHAMGLSVVPDKNEPGKGYLVFTNRGLGANPDEAGSKIYRLDDVKKVSPEFINNMINGHSNGTSHADIMAQMHQVTGGKEPVSTITQKAQKHDNCTIANPRSNIQGILLCQKAIEKGGFDKIASSDRDAVYEKYKNYTSEMRIAKADELTTALKNNPKDPDLNNLAKEYLNQHTKVDPGARARLESAMESKPQGTEDSFDVKMRAPGR